MKKILILLSIIAVSCNPQKSMVKDYISTTYGISNPVVTELAECDSLNFVFAQIRTAIAKTNSLILQMSQASLDTYGKSSTKEAVKFIDAKKDEVLDLMIEYNDYVRPIKLVMDFPELYASDDTLGFQRRKSITVKYNDESGKEQYDVMFYDEGGVEIVNSMKKTMELYDLLLENEKQLSSQHKRFLDDWVNWKTGTYRIYK